MSNFVGGYGPLNAEVAIVGEAPGFYEDMEGKPFVGKSGQLLREGLAKVGVVVDECYVTNVIKYRPPNNATPTTKEIVAAREGLAEELLALPNLKAVLLVGGTPLKAVGGTTGITKNRGLVKSSDKNFIALPASIFATLHPAMVLRNRNYYNGWLADLGAFSSLLRPETHETRWEVVHDGERAKQVVSRALRANRAALDIETTIGNPFVDDVKLICLSVAFDDTTGWVFPTTEHPEGADIGWSLTDLQDIFREMGDVKWTMHNGMFDTLMLQHFGIELELEHDTMAMQYLLDVDERKGLEFLTGVYLSLPPYKGVDYEHIFDEPLDKIMEMNAKDTVRTWRLYEPLAEKMNKNLALVRVYRWVLMPALISLLKVTTNGVPVDKTHLEWLADQLRHREEDSWLALKALAGDEYNPRSSQQTAKVLYEVLNLPELDHTPKGQPKTDKDTLLQLQELATTNVQEKFLGLLQEAKTVESHRRFIPQWERNIAADGRIHPRYKPLHVVTGRLSSETPNIQQVPREKDYRKVFVAPEGKIWVKADYSQIELRIAAWLAGEKKMLYAYKTGADLHRLTAKLVLGDDSDEARQVAKPINFGLLYGGGWKTLQRIARKDYGVHITEWEAKRYVKAHFAAYPALKQWHEITESRIKRDKKSVSPLGRIRYLPDIDHMEEGKRWAAAREGINHPVQSFASDILLSALVRLDNMGWKWLEPIATVHDEIDFLVPEGCDISPIKPVMEDTEWLKKFGIKLEVPIVVDIEAGTNWGDLKEVRI